MIIFGGNIVYTRHRNFVDHNLFMLDLQVVDWKTV